MNHLLGLIDYYANQIVAVRNRGDHWMVPVLRERLDALTRQHLLRTV